MTGLARLSWPLVFRPLHDALIENVLDNAARHVTGHLERPTRCSSYVRALRRIVAAARSTQDRHPR